MSARQRRYFGESHARLRSLVLLPLLLLTMVVVPPSDGVAAAPARQTAAAAVPWEHKGFTLASYAENDLYNSGAALQQLADAGANSVTFAVTWYTPHQYSSDIYRTGSTSSDGALIWAVGRAKALGLKVILKPHLDSQDGAWRAFINPGDADRWFTNYGAMINHYADLGRLHAADGLCVGAELISMSTNPGYDGRWRALITGVRGRFAGKLIYSANWGADGFAEEYPDVPFWDALDYLGISAYFELATHNAPSVEQLRASWATWRANKIDPFQRRWNKPLLFIEGGYRSVDGAARQPWNYDSGGPFDGQEQVDLYEALFQTWSGVPWFAGSAFWFWSPDANTNGYGTGYEVQNKPAQSTVRAWFSGTGGGTPPPPPPPTGELTVSAPLTLDRATVGPGQVLTGRVTYRNAGTSPVAVQDIVITARPPGGTNAGGPYHDFSPRGGAVIVAPGAEVTVTASRQFTSADPTGTWYAFATYQDAAGVYHDAPTRQEFTVGVTAPPPEPTPAPPPAPPPTTCPLGQYRAEYFNNVTLAGATVLSRCEGAISYDWGNGGPGGGVASDNFSARWTGRFSFAAGNYEFTVRADDGIRLWVDGAPLLDEWRDQGPTTFRAPRQLTAGEHEVRVEYYERAGGATAQVGWLAAVAPPPPGPTAANLALGKPATADSACGPGEGAVRANDGTVANNSKWCSLGADKWWQVDLGAPATLSRFVLKHAGTGGENAGWNTRDFAIDVSADGVAWATVVNVAGNGASETSHPIAERAARYVRVRVLTPTATGDSAARIYEIEVYGAAQSGTEPPPPAAANLALGKPATADSACDPGEGAARANDGTTANNSKWCSLGADKWWRVDLGAPATLSRFALKHAGGGGEQAGWNTRDFTIQVSTDGVVWATVVTVSGNTAGETAHPIADTPARYVRVRVAVPTSTGDVAARIYEIEIYGR